MPESDKSRGLYGKYRVERVDGKDKGPHFVLGYATDQHARVALRAYAESCREDYPALAADLDAELSKYAPPAHTNDGAVRRLADDKEREFVATLDPRLDLFLNYLADEYKFPLTVEARLSVYHFFVEELNNNPSSRYLIAEALTAAANRLTADRAVR